MGRNLADGGATRPSNASRAPAPRTITPVHRPAAGNPRTRNLADGGYTPPARNYQQAATRVPSRGGAPSRYGPAPAVPQTSVRSAAGRALIAGGIGAAQGAVAPVAPAPVESFSGSGRSRGFSSGGGGSGGGGGGGGVSPVTAAATAIAPPPAAVQPPPVVNPATAGAGNTAGAAFNKVGLGSGTFGQEQRRRQARGPATGLSVTPEMLRRAATQRIG